MLLEYIHPEDDLESSFLTFRLKEITILFEKLHEVDASIIAIRQNTIGRAPISFPKKAKALDSVILDQKLASLSSKLSIEKLRKIHTFLLNYCRKIWRWD